MGENLISIQVIGRKILLKMPKNEAEYIDEYILPGIFYRYQIA